MQKIDVTYYGGADVSQIVSAAIELIPDTWKSFLQRPLKIFIVSPSRLPPTWENIWGGRDNFKRTWSIRKGTPELGLVTEIFVCVPELELVNETMMPIFWKDVIMSIILEVFRNNFASEIIRSNLRTWTMNRHTLGNDIAQIISAFIANREKAELLYPEMRLFIKRLEIEFASVYAS
ncbi:MAG TPA: hypothetical protein VL335_01540 [Candidatus Paceibacterota bacterium]|nr:hypothetical protein [Candidatus Paceibacterota bacterium]